MPYSYFFMGGVLLIFLQLVQMRHIQPNLLLLPEKEQPLQGRNQPIGPACTVWLFALNDTLVTHAD